MYFLIEDAANRLEFLTVSNTFADVNKNSPVIVEHGSINFSISTFYILILRNIGIKTQRSKIRDTNTNYFIGE